MTAIRLPPICWPLTVITVFSLLKSRLASLKGFRMGSTFSTPGIASSGTLWRIATRVGTFAFDRSHERRLFAADIRARSAMHIDVDRVVDSECLAHFRTDVSFV